MSINFSGTNFRDDISKTTEFREINLTPNFFREKETEVDRQREADRDRETEKGRETEIDRER